ncbi:hypothetical protein Y032_0041g426 [Ancylostoma ceylanicum]|nr:hypothetical protein Y032_0041g426 [Ancylostoma ceylanicum]
MLRFLRSTTFVTNRWPTLLLVASEVARVVSNRSCASARKCTAITVRLRFLQVYQKHKTYVEFDHIVVRIRPWNFWTKSEGASQNIRSLAIRNS